MSKRHRAEAGKKRRLPKQTSRNTMKPTAGHLSPAPNADDCITRSGAATNQKHRAFDRADRERRGMPQRCAAGTSLTSTLGRHRRAVVRPGLAERPLFQFRKSRILFTRLRNRTELGIGQPSGTKLKMLSFRVRQKPAGPILSYRVFFQWAQNNRAD